MRVLITNIAVSARSGTELVTVEVALRLVAAGHSVAVYTPLRGPTAQILEPRGVVVADRIAVLGGFAPDIIHGQHNTPFLVARAAFPDAPAVWSCHDFRSPWDRPPPAASAQLFIAHSTETAERLRREGGIDPARIRMLPNAADLAVFAPPTEAPPARGVLVVGKGGDVGALPAVARRLREAGHTVTCVGPGIGPVVTNLPEIMAAHAVVVSSGRVALEALACGRALVLADARGLAGLVTPANFHALRRRNFGGATLTRALDPDAVLAEIGMIDPQDQAKLLRMAVPEIGLDRYVERLSAIHAEAIALADSPAAGEAIRGAEMLEAMLASPRADGFGPDALRRLRADHAARLAAAENEAARLALRLRLATLKAAEPLRIAHWHRGPGAALLGPGWSRVEEGRVALAGQAVLDLTEALAQRKLGRVVLVLSGEGAPGLSALDGKRVVAEAHVDGGVAVLDLTAEALAAVKSLVLRAAAGGRWTLREATLEPVFARP